MDRHGAIDYLAERCRSSPGAVFFDLLDRLRTRTDSLAAAVVGYPLRFEVSLAGSDVLGQRVSVTGHGHVIVVTEQALLGQEYRPDVVVEGAPRRLLAALLDDDGPDLDTRAFAQVPDEVERLRSVLAVVAEELSAMASDYEGRRNPSTP